MKFATSTIMLLGALTLPLEVASRLTDRTDRWKIGGKKKKWCSWARRKNQVDRQRRCTKKNLFDNCPVTCGPHPSEAPSVSPTTTNVDAFFVEVPCRGGDQCHPIQWPYIMEGCYPDATALEDCARETRRVSGKAIAFSLQDCYDEPEANKKYCFIYENAPANPKECQIDVFSQDKCIYGTKDGAFYILKDEYSKRFTNPVDAFVEVPCRGGDQCHPIQWPYNMRGCYPDATALEDCARETTRVSGEAIAFSLQDCYDEPEANKKYCFIYENAPANPKECQIDVFSQDKCIYGTKDGAFYILRDEYSKRFTNPTGEH